VAVGTFSQRSIAPLVRSPTVLEWCGNVVRPEGNVMSKNRVPLRIRISPSVVNILGAEIVSRYRCEHRGPEHCSVCQGPIVGVAELIAEVGEVCQDSNVIVAGLSLTHPGCARSQVIRVDASDLIDPDEDAAIIRLCTRLAPAPRAVAVVDSLKTFP
jgi:hypothetical protein